MMKAAGSSSGFSSKGSWIIIPHPNTQPKPQVGHFLVLETSTHLLSNKLIQFSLRVDHVSLPRQECGHLEAILELGTANLNHIIETSDELLLNIDFDRNSIDIPTS